MADNDKNSSLPDISGLFDIDDSKVPDRLIKKDSGAMRKNSAEPILTAPEGVRFLPKEEREKVKKENRRKQKEIVKKRTKNRIIVLLCAIIFILLSSGFIKFIVSDSQKPAVTVAKPCSEDISQYFAASGTAVMYNNILSAVFIDNSYDVHEIKKGLPVEITSGEKHFSGKIAEIKEETPDAPIIERFFALLTGDKPQTSVYAVYVIPDEENMLNAEGEKISVKVNTKTVKDTLTLPSAAINISGNQYFVWIYEPLKKELRRQDITAGISSDGKTQVTAGIHKGDRVVISVSCDKNKLYDGIKVKKD